MARLTKSDIGRWVYRGDGKSRDVRWDDAIPGFGVRIYPSGRKAFVLSYRFGRRKRLMALGDFDPLETNLDEFRKRARRHLTRLEDGVDPLEERRRIVQAKTFGELLTRYISEHAKPKKRLGRETSAGSKCISRRSGGIDTPAPSPTTTLPTCIGGSESGGPTRPTD